MSEKVKQDILSRIQKIEDGSFTLDDLKLFFISVRDSLDLIQKREVAGILFDIFDFCAHPSASKRGDLFKLARKACKEFVSAVKESGSVEGLPQEVDFISLIGNSLVALGLIFDRAKLEAQSQALTRGVYEILNDTEFLIKDSDKDTVIEYSEISYDKDMEGLFISFKLRSFTFTRADNLTISADGATLKFKFL